MAKTNKSEDPEGGNESSNEENSEEETKSDSPREESSEDGEIEWNDEFMPVERDPAANIRPYMHLFPVFTVKELISLMPITFKIYIESTRHPCSSCTYPPQNPGEVSHFVESWRNRFPSYGNVGSTSSSTQRTHHSQNPQYQVPDAGNQTTDKTEYSEDQAASKGQKN